MAPRDLIRPRQRAATAVVPSYQLNLHIQGNITPYWPPTTDEPADLSTWVDGTDWSRMFTDTEGLVPADGSLQTIGYMHESVNNPHHWQASNGLPAAPTFNPDLFGAGVPGLYFDTGSTQLRDVGQINPAAKWGETACHFFAAAHAPGATGSVRLVQPASGANFRQTLDLTAGTLHSEHMGAGQWANVNAGGGPAVYEFWRDGVDGLALVDGVAGAPSNRFANPMTSVPEYFFIHLGGGGNQLHLQTLLCFTTKQTDASAAAVRAWLSAMLAGTQDREDAPWLVGAWPL